MLALLPLWLGILYVSRWHALQHATIGAARHAAFEAWVDAGRGDPAELTARTRRPGVSDDPARFAGAVAEPDLPLAQRPLWRDQRGGRLVTEPGPRVRIDPAAQPEQVEQAESFAFALIAPARAVGGPRFDLQRTAARRGEVAVPLQHAADLPEPFGGLRFTLVERLELLVDTWAAADPAQVARRTAALSPSAALRELARPLDPVREAVALFEPAFERVCPGRIEPDIVPGDRLLGARDPVDLRLRPC